MSVLFILNALLLGTGLAMDAFTVSIADGLCEPDMSFARKAGIAGIFGLFQTIMPLIGWFCVHHLLQLFQALETLIPWIALILLVMIGGNMIKEAGEETDVQEPASFAALLLQGIATSIDALSVGLTIAEYSRTAAVTAAVLIGIVTFVICLAGLYIGVQAGTRFNRRASLAGGIILICIGLEIFIKGMFF